MQKVILPGLVLVVVGFIYFTYFSPTDELGLFSSFDTNNNASRDIVVKFVASKGIERDVQNGSTTFYVVDKAGREVRVSGPSSLPPGLQDVNTIVLKGHLHDDYFHAHEVVPR